MLHDPKLPHSHFFRPEDFPEVSFSCSSRRGGAVLSIPVEGQRQNTLVLGDFGRWMVKHIDHWLAFAQRLGLGITQMEEIVLVTGYDCSRSWTNVAFLEGEGDARVSFGVDVGVGPDTRITWHFSPERIRGALLNQGPEGQVCWYVGFPRANESEKALARSCARRTYPRINAYSFEGFVSLEPSGSYQNVLRPQQEFLLILTRMTMIRTQTMHLFHYRSPPSPRYVKVLRIAFPVLHMRYHSTEILFTFCWTMS